MTQYSRIFEQAKIVSQVGHDTLKLRNIFVVLVVLLLVPLPFGVLVYALKLGVAVVFVQRIYRLKSSVEALLVDTLHGALDGE